MPGRHALKINKTKSHSQIPIIENSFLKDEGGFKKNKNLYIIDFQT